MKKTALKVGVGVTAVAFAQGVYIRSKFSQSINPEGPYYGTENWIENVKNELTKNRLKSEILFRKIGDLVISDKPRRKIKLLLLGDSLVCGVGSTDLVLPRVMAKTLSVALQADVSWHARGINGGTAEQLLTLVPSLKEDICHSDIQQEELYVVVICGLNDWKTVLTQFPHGSGPIIFKENLSKLLNDIKDLSGGQCRIFLPALPIACVASDPQASLQVRPLKYFVDYVCGKWDYQKKILAESLGDCMNVRELLLCNSHLIIWCQVTYIDQPDVRADFATPGHGNVSEDGVHPSAQGYAWWARHIASVIIESAAAKAAR